MKFHQQACPATSLRLIRPVQLAVVYLSTLLFVFPDPAPAVSAEPRPNVLFISIDDQNDWIGCLGGHPLVKTPHIDRLASRGTLFTNAHCQAPLCNPSRTSLLTGLRPSTTGIHGLTPWFRTVDQFRDHQTLPQHFRQAGYQNLVTGKIYHGGYPPAAELNAEFTRQGPPSSGGPRPPQKLVSPTPHGNHPLVDWGTFPHRDEEKGDWKIATWVAQELQKLGQQQRATAAADQQPFFLAAGFFLPHVPCYVTERWWEMYPDDDSILPPVLASDREDTPRFSWYLHWELPEPRLNWLRSAGQWRALVRAYLASVSFMDSQVGRILEALDESGLADNTIVVLWSDHGWHLGEKGITGKNSLWERSTRVPLIFAGPTIARGARCAAPAELLDLFPTLIELCQLPPRGDLEGHSLVPQLRNANAERTFPAITTHNQGNHAVRSRHWRYIRYADGSEELYDHRVDANEWTNLAARPEHAAVLADHRRYLPAVDRPAAPGSTQRVLTYDPTTREATWEGKPIDPHAAIPE
ncbi:MAG: sulfatase [Planctomycetota bacterium]